MRKFSFRTQIFAASFFIATFSLFLVTWYASETGRQLYLQKTEENLQDHAILISGLLDQNNNLKNPEFLQRKIHDLGPTISLRITVMKQDGTVIADSEQDPKVMDNHSLRPEVILAMAKGHGKSLRFSDTVKHNMMYFALFRNDASGHGLIIRTSKTVSVIEETISILKNKIFSSGFFIALIATLIGFMVSRRLTKPLESIISAVKRLANGELSTRFSEPNTKEMALLTNSLNKMALQIDEKVKTIIRHKEEQKAVFGSMAEGVIAVDKDARILSVNNTALRLFNFQNTLEHGTPIRQAIDNLQIENLFLAVIRNGEALEEEISLSNPTEMCVKISARVLADDSGKTIGALMVINDITRLRNLEAGRREFVANVSHELRTPLTSIKGFAEALNDGAIDEPKNARRFVETIYRQANRLGNILEDILTLSRLDREDKFQDIEFTNEKINSVIKEAVQICKFNAGKKNIEVFTDCDPELKVTISVPLIEEALVNLIDNAVKYSPENSSVFVKGLLHENEIMIHVEDQGNGIEKEHLSRIFERFYRVDKARSRNLGGTGLGLAIVKHIAMVHDGQVDVESEPGVGSTFSISFPIRNEDD